MSPAQVDIRVERDGELFLFTPLSTAAQQWVAHNVDPQATRLGDALVIEGHLLSDLVRGALMAGLVVRPLDG